MKNLIERDPYSRLLRLVRDDGRIKVLSGVRRSGKSSLLNLLRTELLNEGRAEEEIVYLNFEIFKYKNWTDDDLYNYLIERSENISGKKLYILLDEIQNIPGWEKVVNSLRLEIDCDIYVTGSNAYLVSSQFSTLLSGRTVTIEILPFSFSEFLRIRGIDYKRNSEKFSISKWILTNSEGIQLNLEELFSYYRRYGGLPSLTDFDNHERIELELNEIQQTIINRDIIESRLLNNQRNITDPSLLNQVFYYLLESVGNLTSFNKITNTLISKKFLDSSEKKKPTNKTITAYTQALKEAFIIYEVKRFDIKGKKVLSSSNKYYSVDTGLRNQTLDYPENNKGFELENIVFLELKRRGWNIRIGKIKGNEIDFLVQKSGKKAYIQVTETMKNVKVAEREINALRGVKDIGRKIIITGEINDPISSIEDIEIIPIVDFLLDQSLL